MVDVGDDVGDTDDVAFQREGARLRAAAQQLALLALGVFEDAVAHFDGQVEAAPVVLQLFHHAHRLAVMIEAALDQLVQRRFAGVAERGVSEVVAEADGLGEDFVEAQRLGNGARDLRHLEHVRQARSVVIALGCQEHLRLVFEPAERLAVDDAVAVALVGGPEIVFGLLAIAPARVHALRGLRRERVVLDLFEHLADVHQIFQFIPTRSGGIIGTTTKDVQCGRSDDPAPRGAG